MAEIWKDIKGYEGLYQISNTGRVTAYEKMSGWYLKPAHELKVHDNGKEYLYVDLYNSDHKRKKYYIHRLVALAFIPNPNNLPDINHKDENKKNNNVENLEWCDAKYNCNYGNHAIKSRLAHLGKNKGKDNVGSKKVVCTTTGVVFDCIREAADFYNIQNLRSHISTWCNGNKKFNYLGKLPDGTKLKWMYYDDYIAQ